jgi:MFS family permease
VSGRVDGESAQHAAVPVPSRTGEVPIVGPECGPPVGSSLAWATWSLFVGLALLLVGVGLFATVVGIRSELNGYEDWQIGLIAAAYYGGFLVGSRLTLVVLEKVGHIRVYAALASILSATMIIVGLTHSAEAWIAIRFASGMCIAGLYVVAESWLNQLASNENRGRLLAVYMVVTSGAYGVGQLIVGPFNPLDITAFAFAAMLTSVAVAPVALSEDAVPPPLERIAKLQLRQLARVVPTGVGTCFLVGIAHGALVAIGVVYATREGLTPAEAGRFVAATAIGGMIAQWPLSSASDEIDRRFVGVVAGFGAVAAGVWLLLAGPFGWQGIAAMALLGAHSYPLYSIAAAYTNDWVEPEHVNGAASQLVLLYGAGALIGPPIASWAMSAFGSNGYPWAMIGMHAAIVAFLIYRLFAWRAPLKKRPWSESSLAARAFFIPATVVGMGLRVGRRARRAAQQSAG